MDDETTTCWAAIEPRTDDPLAATDDPLAPLGAPLWAEVTCLLLTVE